MHEKLNKELHQAIQTGDEARIIDLVARGADLHDDDDEALRVGCSTGNMDVVRLLIRLGADVNTQRKAGPDVLGYRVGVSPLSIAAGLGNIAMMRELEFMGADIKEAGSKPVRDAVNAGHRDAFQYLLKKGINISEYKQQLFIQAIRKGHLPLVIDLIALGARLNDPEFQPLLTACKAGYADIAQQLIMAGSDVHTDNNSALKAAVEAGHADVVHVLVKRGADVHVGNNMLLKTAALKGHNRILQHLIFGGADINATDNNDVSPLSIACSWGRFHTVQLLAASGADVLKESGSLFYSAVAHHKSEPKYLDFLLLAGADIEACHVEGERPIYSAIGHHNFEAVQKLINAGASITASDINRLINALCFQYDAISDNDDDNDDDEFDLSEKWNFDENGNLIDEQTPYTPYLTIDRLNLGLNSAAKINLGDLVQLLIRWGANAIDEAFSKAVESGAASSVRALLAAGADCLADDYKAIRIADAPFDCIGPGMSHDDGLQRLIQVLLECGKFRAPDYRTQFPPEKALLCAMDVERDPRALLALHQHGLWTLKPYITNENSEEVIMRYFGIDSKSLNT